MQKSGGLMKKKWIRNNNGNNSDLERIFSKLSVT